MTTHSNKMFLKKGLFMASFLLGCYAPPDVFAAGNHYTIHGDGNARVVGHADTIKTDTLTQNIEGGKANAHVTVNFPAAPGASVVKPLKDIRELRRYFLDGFFEITHENCSTLHGFLSSYEQSFQSYDGGIFVKWYASGSTDSLLDVLFGFANVTRFKMHMEWDREGLDVSDVLSRSFCTYQNLSELSLSGCRLNDKGMIDIIGNICKPDLIHFFDITDNPITPAVLERIRGRFTRLHVLKVDDNLTPEHDLAFHTSPLKPNTIGSISNTYVGRELNPEEERIQNICRDITTIERGVVAQIEQMGMVNTTRVLILGSTGAGKTTLVHSLAGKQIEAKEIEDGYVLIVSKDQMLGSGFNISHNAVVGTTIPNSWYDKENDLVYWDCPGFFDPRGVEQELINAFSIYRLFQAPSKIKILLAIEESQLKSSRAQHFFDSLDKITQIMPVEAQRHGAVSLVITKQRDISKPIEKLSKLKNEAAGKTTDVMNLLQHLIDHPVCVSIFTYPRDEGAHQFKDRDRVLSVLKSNAVQNPNVAILRNSAVELLIVEVSRDVDNRLRSNINSFAQSMNEEIIKGDEQRVHFYDNFLTSMTQAPEGETSLNFIRRMKELLKVDRSKKYNIHNDKYQACLTDIEEQNAYLNFFKKIERVPPDIKQLFITQLSYIQQTLDQAKHRLMEAKAAKQAKEEADARIAALKEEIERKQKQDAENQLRAEKERAAAAKKAEEDLKEKQRHDAEMLALIKKTEDAEKRFLEEKEKAKKAENGLLLKRKEEERLAALKRAEDAEKQQRMEKEKAEASKKAEEDLKEKQRHDAEMLALIKKTENAEKRLLEEREKAKKAEYELKKKEEERAAALKKAEEEERQKIQSEREALEKQRKKTESERQALQRGLTAVVERPHAGAIPSFARGYEEIYNRFINGKLIFDNKAGQVRVFEFRQFGATLEGEFDLTGLTFKSGSTQYEVSDYLRIKLGYRKAKEDEAKTTVWLTPKFFVDKSTSEFKGVDWTSPVGIFWTWGQYDLASFDHLTSYAFDEISSKNLYDLAPDCGGSTCGEAGDLGVWDGADFLLDDGYVLPLFLIKL